MPNETTKLPPNQEALFREWARQANVQDVDHPDSHYDYRGWWLDPQAREGWKPGDHFIDRYKQHGHPTFSVESKYSKGPADGGSWLGDTFLPPIVRELLKRKLP